jgi:Phasin protein
MVFVGFNRQYVRSGHYGEVWEFFWSPLRRGIVQNINAVHELVKRLSQAKDFEEALRIQTAFMHSQLNVLGKQATSLGEAYTKAAVSKASKGSSD